MDDLAARFDVADVLAREVISVGVGGLAFHVQRESLGDAWACPYCEYVPAEPAPRVSWLTGVITAAGLVKTASGLPVLDRRVDVDLSGRPQGFTRRVKADAPGRCACASGIRRRWMVNLYGGPQ